MGNRRWVLVIGMLVVAGCGGAPPGDLEAGGGVVEARSNDAAAGTVATAVTASTAGPEGTAPDTTAASSADGITSADGPVTTTTVVSVTTRPPVATTTAPTTTTVRVAPQTAPPTLPPPTAPPTTVDTRMQPQPWSGALTAEERDLVARVEQAAGHPLVVESTLMAIAGGGRPLPKPPWLWWSGPDSATGQGGVDALWPGVAGSVAWQTVTHVGVSVTTNGTVMTIAVVSAQWVA